jgi:hypothetical protein
MLRGEKLRLEGENQQQVAKAQEVEQLQTKKAIWPKILNMVHSALPAPDPEITQALSEGPRAFKTLVASDPAKYDRAKRRQLFIREFSSEYYQDVAATLAQKLSGATGSGSTTGQLTPPHTSAATTALKDGFVITLHCQTPYAGGDLAAVVKFIDTVIVPSLKRAGEKEKGVYIDEVRYLGSPVSLREGIGRSSVASPSPGRPVTGGALSGSADEMKDPVTDEPTSKDWQFQLVLSVMLGDKPPPQGSGVTGAAPADSDQ